MDLAVYEYSNAVRRNVPAGTNQPEIQVAAIDLNRHSAPFPHLSASVLLVSIYLLESRSCSRKETPLDANFASKTLVQSQSQHAHGSVPFSCRQFLRE